MKKLLSIATIATLVFLGATLSFADPSGTVDVKVTIDHTLSIDITGGPIDFGKLGVGQTAVSAGAISVKNDGSGLDEDITLSVANPTGWTQGTPAKDVYRISFQASDTKPTAGDANWKLPADFSETLAYDATKKLWVKLETPTTTNVTAEQIIKVTITAG